jgi:hypothetical protein
MKVQIKEWDEMEKKYGLSTTGSIQVPYGFPLGMKSLCGQEIKLIEMNYMGPSSMLGKYDGWTISLDMCFCSDDCKTCVWKFHKNLTRECNQFYQPIKT